MATSNKLTDAICRSVRSEGKALKLFDGEGMYLWVSASGAKTWRLSYRQAGKPNTLSFGPYPEVSLAEARARRAQVRAEMRQGVYPAPRVRGSTRAAPSLEDACDDYWTGRQDISESYRENALRALQRYLYPTLGKKALRDITREDLLKVLSPMEAAGKLVYLRRVRLWLGQVFERALEHGQITIDPCKQINTAKAFRKSAVEHFAAVDLAEVPALLVRLSLENQALQSVLGLKMLALTWTRTTELRFMQWDELDGDIWRIPGERMKRRQDHVVPLSRQALSILDTMRQRVGRPSPFVFPADHRPDRPMSENAMLYLLYRIGYKGRMTGHGWRSLGSTWANERGYRADAIERQLAHRPKNQVRSIYNRAEYLSERRVLLQDWADWLDDQLHKSNSSGDKR